MYLKSNQYCLYVSSRESRNGEGFLPRLKINRTGGLTDLNERDDLFLLFFTM